MQATSRSQPHGRFARNDHPMVDVLDTGFACGRPTKRKHTAFLKFFPLLIFYKMCLTTFDHFGAHNMQYSLEYHLVQSTAGLVLTASLRSSLLKQHPSRSAPPTMPRRRNPGRAEEPYRTFPSLHDEVSALLEEEDLYFSFRDGDDPAGCVREYDTNIMGRFACRNGACGEKGWSSKKIAITIRMYPGAEYNARVYKQRCRRCGALGDLSLERDGGSYADRVAYRIKKWCGVDLEPPAYSGTSKGPHEKKLCEGCKAGHCKEGGFDGLS